MAFPGYICQESESLQYAREIDCTFLIKGAEARLNRSLGAEGNFAMHRGIQADTIQSSSRKKSKLPRSLNSEISNIGRKAK